MTPKNVTGRAASVLRDVLGHGVIDENEARRVVKVLDNEDLLAPLELPPSDRDFQESVWRGLPGGGTVLVGGSTGEVRIDFGGGTAFSLKPYEAQVLARTLASAVSTVTNLPVWSSEVRILDKQVHDFIRLYELYSHETSFPLAIARDLVMDARQHSMDVAESFSRIADELLEEINSAEVRSQYE